MVLSNFYTLQLQKCIHDTIHDTIKCGYQNSYVNVFKGSTVLLFITPVLKFYYYYCHEFEPNVFMSETKCPVLTGIYESEFWLGDKDLV